MVCKKCSELRKSIANTPVVSGAGAFPSTKDLAYMVNLEYYVNIAFSCIHNIPDDETANIKIKDMITFLDGKKWQMVSRTDYEGFYCTSFLNRPAKQVVIVHRGTENWEHFKTDIMVARGVVTQDVIKKADWHTRDSLMNNALEEENSMFVRNDYSVTITGHSLGGWLAQICTLIAKYPNFHPVGPRGMISFPNGKSINMSQPYDLHCVAFDSPGASTVLNQIELASATAQPWFSGEKRDVERVLSDLDISVYLSNPNPVNLCRSHVGRKVPMDVMPGASFWQRWFPNPCASHSMEKILKYFIEKG